MSAGNFTWGDLVVFQPNGAEKPLKGRIRIGPVGKHRTYTVKTFDGEVYKVPQVLLEPLSN